MLILILEGKIEEQRKTYRKIFFVILLKLKLNKTTVGGDRNRSQQTRRRYFSHLGFVKLDPDPNWVKQLDPDPQKRTRINSPRIFCTIKAEKKQQIFIIYLFYFFLPGSVYINSSWKFIIKPDPDAKHGIINTVCICWFKLKL